MVLDGRMTSQQTVLEHLGEASQRLVRTVDSFHGDDWRAPSQLPGWTRAHVGAHLALNAEGLARALRGVVAGEAADEPRTMYDSDEARDRDIAELAAADPAEIRERLMAGVTSFADAAAAVPEDAWDARIERTPGGTTFSARAVPGMRWREVEIHHVDLAAGYAADDWPQVFSESVIEAMAKRVEAEQPFDVKPMDSAGTWCFGESCDHAVVVTGPAAEIAWWLTGREPAESVTSSRGHLPEIGAW